jgi:hypothetical protein
VGGLVNEFPARMRLRDEQAPRRMVRAQVANKRIHVLDRRHDPALDLLQESSPIDCGTRGIERGMDHACGGPECCEDVYALALAVVTLLACLTCRAARLLTRCKVDQEGSLWWAGV